jgi:DNA polymerase (family 10)
VSLPPPPKCDLHTHSTWSDGILSIEELVDHADLRDLEVLAITDHYPAMGHHHAVQDNPLGEYFTETRRLKIEALERGVRLLAGLEFDVSGDIHAVPLQNLDILLVEGLGGNPETFFPQFFSIAHHVRKVRGRDFPLVIAHPFFGSMTTTKHEAQISLLENLDVAIELNTSYRNFIQEPALFEYFAQATDLRFSLGSDAHNGEFLGQIGAGWSFLQRYNIPSRFILAHDFGIA